MVHIMSRCTRVDWNESMKSEREVVSSVNLKPCNGFLNEGM
jgi:hypothetical protein